jgi:L-malate glycosyltransferase
MSMKMSSVQPIEVFRKQTNRRPVVCQLLHTLHVGGAEMLAARLGRQLRSECHFVYVCLDEAGTLGEELREEGFSVEVLGRRKGVDWRCARRLANILRSAQVDLVHAHQYTPFFYGQFARLFYRQPAVLFTEHGRHFPDFPRLKRKIANRLLLERRDRVVGVGQAVRQALIDNEGIPDHRVGVIYNGIDADGFHCELADKGPARRALGMAADDFVILLVARLDYLKDHATALRTMKRVVRKCPKAKLILVGEGPEQARIEELMKEHLLDAHVSFLGLRKDISRLLNASDLFLLTSISEGIPLTVLEAMAAGLPVVATSVGGVPEIVEKDQTGLLARSGDDVCLAEHILRLAASPELCGAMGRRGRERARTVFSESRMHARYLELYREMLHA